MKQIKKLDAGYCCVCSGNSIYTIENKVNEMIDRLNAEDCIHEVTSLYQDNCNKCGKPCFPTSKLIQHKTDYEYDCTCGYKPRYIGSEWKWRCPKCGANNYEKI